MTISITTPWELRSASEAVAETTKAEARNTGGPGLDGAGAILPAPTIMDGDIGAAIAVLGIKAGRDEQQINQDAEQTADKLQQAAEKAEVHEMRREAGDIMTSGFETFAMQVGQGETQIAGAGASQSAQLACQGGATLWGAGAGLSTAFGQAQQQLDQAEVTASKAVADSAEQTATTARQGETDAQSVIQAAIQFFQQYAQTKSQIDLLAAGQKA